jgi:deoxyribodipyrimidine photolyase
LLTTNGVTIVWFRQDLRLGDNPALHAAAWRPGEAGAHARLKRFLRVALAVQTRLS